MKKKKKDKKKLKISKKGKAIFISFFLIISFSLIYFFLVDHSIRSIFVYNNNILSDGKIIDLAKISNYPNFYTTFSNDIKNNIMTSEYIKDISIKKRFFHEVHIYVTEYSPLFFDNEKGKVILENGNEVAILDEMYLPIMINHTPDTKYNDFIEKFALIDISIRNKISEIKYDPNAVDEDRFLLYMNDGNYVYITLTKMNLLNMYNETITKLEGKKGILYLDSGNYFEIK